MLRKGLVSVKTFVIAIAVIALACGPSILTPKTGPGTDYPCGVGWYVCPNSPVKGGGCCLESDVCGGQQPDQPVTCPSGMCCNEGIGQNDEAKRKPKPRRYHQAPVGN
jgi:hypothetical protein